VAHPYDAELDAYLAGHDIPFEVRTGNAAICAERRHRLEAIQRWFYNTWTRLDPKIRASIVEGIVVFLSLFDENPAVYRAFCPPRSAYIQPPKADEPKPLPPLEDLLETGHVLGLNFPVAMNPALARGLGRNAQAGFPARGPANGFRKLRQIRKDPGDICCSSPTSITRLQPSAKPIRRATNARSALSRQARLIPIVATQSISSLRSALGSDEAWRTLLQCFRTKVFLATSDEFTAKIAGGIVRPCGFD